MRLAKRVAKRDKEEERARVIRQKIEEGKEITVYVNTRAIDRKLGHIKLDVNSRDSILSEVDDRKCCWTNYP